MSDADARRLAERVVETRGGRCCWRRGGRSCTEQGRVGANACIVCDARQVLAKAERPEED